MNSTAIDLDTLNELFDNQKKLDDLFSSFDEDIALVPSVVPTNEHVIGKMPNKVNDEYYSHDDVSLFTDNTGTDQKKRHMAFIIMPVALEVAAISYLIVYFN